MLESSQGSSLKWKRSLDEENVPGAVLSKWKLCYMYSVDPTYDVWLGFTCIALSSHIPKHFRQQSFRAETKTTSQFQFDSAKTLKKQNTPQN